MIFVQNVLEFDVPMNDAHAMKVDKSTENLFDHIFGVMLIEFA